MVRDEKKAIYLLFLFICSRSSSLNVLWKDDVLWLPKYKAFVLHFSYVVPVLLIMVLLSRTSYHIQRREKAQSALHRSENESEHTELILQQQQGRRVSATHTHLTR